MKQRKSSKKLQILTDVVSMRLRLHENKLYKRTKEKSEPKFTKFFAGIAGVAGVSRAFTPGKSQSEMQIEIKNKIASKLQTQTVTTPNKSRRISESPALSPALSSSSPLSLRFLFKLSPTHFLIGNSYQLDMFSISTVDTYVDTEFKWTLTPVELISSAAVQPRLGLIAIVSARKLYLYRYDIKKDTLSPTLSTQSQISPAQTIHSVTFIKSQGLFVFMEFSTHFFRVDWIHQLPQLVHSMHYKYPLLFGMHLFKIPPPPAGETIINVYFAEMRGLGMRGKFGLWMLTFQFPTGVSTPTISPLAKVYDIDVAQKSNIEIFNYSPTITLIKFQSQLHAIRQGFMLDSVTTNFHQRSCFLLYLDNKSIVHFTTTTIDIYQFTINEKSRPQKIIVNCVDSVEWEGDKHSTSHNRVWKVLQINDGRYIVFYIGRDKHQGEVDYSFTVTRPISLQNKINEVYPSTCDEIDGLSQELLDQKCDIVKKLGLSTKSAFLQLWKRSSKKSGKDFHILLSTEDYQTIVEQIQGKLRVHAMGVRQLIKLQEECREMLHQRVYGERCQLADLEEYARCHFFISKLKMYRSIRDRLRGEKQQHNNQTQHNETQHNEQQHITINVQDYHWLREMSIKNEFIDFIAQLLNSHSSSQSQALIIKIRALLRYFKIVFKLGYIPIFERILQIAGRRVRELLQYIPEILPIELNQNQIVGGGGIGVGVWGAITEEEINRTLFVSTLRTIDNKSVVNQFCNTLWFKRNALITHSVLTVEPPISLIPPASIFYQLYAFLHNLHNISSLEDRELEELLSFIEEKYSMLPKHLVGRFKLYYKLYHLFEEGGEWNGGVKEFYQLKEIELFGLFFQREKVEKHGFILKKIKPLYESLEGQGMKSKSMKSKSMFSEGLFNYFSSPSSTVSDLKCILNKLNSQKAQFHLSNQHLSQVLLSAIMRKIRIGSGDDTPIPEILVYLQNIPFPISNIKILQDLQYIQQINYEGETLKKIGIDMSLQEIVNNGRKVIERMVAYEIDRCGAMQVTDMRSLKLHLYKILFEVQCRKSNIYGAAHHQYSLFVFLSIIMTRHPSLIRLVRELLKDTYLLEQFPIDQSFTQRMVMTLFKWKVIKERNGFVDSVGYLRELCKLLSTKSAKRQFIQLSIQYAQKLSSPRWKISYPLFEISPYYPTLTQFQRVFNCLSGQELIHLQLDSLIHIMLRLKKLGEKDYPKEAVENRIYESHLCHQLYQIYILRLIQEGQLKQALQTIYLLLKIPVQSTMYNIIYPILIIQKLFKELLEGTITKLIRLVSYYYNYPKELCDILSEMLSNTFNNQQLEQMLDNYAEKKLQLNIYIGNNANPILHPKMRAEIWRMPAREYNRVIEESLRRLTQLPQYCKSIQYQLIFRVVCHYPYALPKLLWCKRSGINIRTLRSFLSYLSLQPIFDGWEVLMAGRKIFQILRFKIQNQHKFMSQIIKFKHKIVFQTNSTTLDQGDCLFKESISAFDAKMAQWKGITPTPIPSHSNHKTKQKQSKLSHSKNQNSNFPTLSILDKIASKQKEIQIIILSPDKLSQLPQPIYYFSDEDNGYEKYTDDLNIKIQKKKSSPPVNPTTPIAPTAMQLIQELFQEEPFHVDRKFHQKSEYYPQMMFQQGQGKRKKPKLRKLISIQPQHQPEPQLRDNSDQHQHDISHDFHNTSNDTSNDNDASLGLSHMSFMHALHQHDSNPMDLLAMMTVGDRDVHRDREAHMERNQMGMVQDHPHSYIQPQTPQHIISYDPNDSSLCVQQNPWKNIQMFLGGSGPDNSTPLLSALVDSVFLIQKETAVKHLWAAVEGKKDITLLQLQVLAREEKKIGFNALVQQVIQCIYHEEKKDVKSKVRLISAIVNAFLKSQVKPEIMQIYERASHSKYLPILNFKLHQILPIEFIYFQSIEALKDSLLPLLHGKSNVMNIFAVDKFISDVFLDRAFRESFIYSALVEQVEKYKACEDRRERQRMKIAVKEWTRLMDRGRLRDLMFNQASSKQQSRRQMASIIESIIKQL